MGSKVGRLRTGGRYSPNDAKIWRRGPVTKPETNPAARGADATLGVTWLRLIQNPEGGTVGGIASPQNASGLLPDITGVGFPKGCNLTVTGLSSNDSPYGAVSRNNILSEHGCPGAAPAAVVATGNNSQAVEACLRGVQFSCKVSEVAAVTLIVFALAAACGGFACMASDCPRSVAPRNSDRREARLLSDNSEDGSVFHASDASSPGCD